MFALCYIEIFYNLSLNYKLILVVNGGLIPEDLKAVKSLVQ